MIWFILAVPVYIGNYSRNPQADNYIPTLFQFNKVSPSIATSRMNRAARASVRRDKCNASSEQNIMEGPDANETRAIVETGIDAISLQETEEQVHVGREEEASEDMDDFVHDLDRDVTLPGEISGEAIENEEDIERDRLIGVDDDFADPEDLDRNEMLQSDDMIENEEDIQVERDSERGEDDDIAENDFDLGITDEEPFEGHSIQEIVEEHEISDDPAVYSIVEDLSYEVCELQSHNEFLLRDVADLKTENELLKRQLDSCSQYTGAIQNAYVCSTQHAASLLVSLSAAKTTKFGAELIHDNDEKTQFYTGLTSYSLFETLFKLLKPFLEKRISKKRPPLWSIKDEFFITLSKLRLGLLYKDITYRI